MILKTNIKKSLDFIYNLIGTKYGWWKKNDDMRYEEVPSYSINQQVPSINYIKKNSINCVGVINLMRRINNLTIPGSDNLNFKYPGGTYMWYKYLDKNNKLEKFDISFKYPRGTLLLRQYRNENKQGHVAVIYRANRINPTIIHALSDNPIPNKNKNEPGLIIEPLNKYSKLFTHICLPQNWLL